NVSTGIDPFGSELTRLFVAGGQEQDIRSVVTVVALAAVETVIPLVLISPFDVAIENRENLVTVDFGASAVVRLNRNTHALTLVSGLGVGTGPLPIQPTKIAVTRNGNIFVNSAPGTIGLAAIMRVAPDTGNRSVVSGCPGVSPPDAHGISTCIGNLVGNGPFLAPRGLATLGTDLLVAD